MGIIKAVAGAIGGGFADQWLETIEPDEMTDNTVFCQGVLVGKNNKRSSNTKGTDGIITDGSVIHVYDNQFMLLVDGGKVVDYTAEPGYFTVNNSAAPSLFNGQFGDALKETLARIQFGGIPSAKQKVFYINLQEIKGIKFGTRNPINYFDNFYNAELFLRAHGTYSIKISDPLKFYQEAIPRNASNVDIKEINEQYMNEFLEALQAAINQLSVDGVRISQVTSKARELSKYMGSTLDDDWKQMRGMEIQSVGLASISYTEDSQKLINMRNQGAMLGDPSVREGYVQGSVARGLEAAGSNSGGAMAGFMGMNMGMNTGGVSSFSETNRQQAQQQQQVNNQNQGAAGGAASGGGEASWTCSCNSQNPVSAKFCSNCGNPKPQAAFCTNCGAKMADGAKFCAECGSKL